MFLQVRVNYNSHLGIIIHLVDAVLDLALTMFLGILITVTHFERCNSSLSKIMRLNVYGLFLNTLDTFRTPKGNLNVPNE